MGRRWSTHATTLLDQKLAIVSVTQSPAWADWGAEL